MKRWYAAARKSPPVNCAGLPPWVVRPNQAKAFTRCGMGPCQGRMCGLTAAAVLARASGRGMAETGHLRIRPPIKPITVGELAGLDGLGAAPDASPAMPTAPKDEAEA